MQRLIRLNKRRKKPKPLHTEINSSKQNGKLSYREGAGVEEKEEK